MNVPAGLKPLPTSPWDERPDEIPLDIEECRTALWISNGNVTEAAGRLKVPAHRLRRFVKNHPALSAVIEEYREGLKDAAEKNLYDALTDEEDPGRRDSMTKFVLTNLGTDRGYGNTKGININTGNTSKGRLMVVWDDGSELVGGEEEPKVLEHE